LPSPKQEQQQHIDISPRPAGAIDFPDVPTNTPREIVYENILPPVPTGEIRARQAQMDDSLPIGDRITEQRAVVTSSRKYGQLSDSAEAYPQAPRKDNHLVLEEREIEQAVTSNSGRGHPTNGYYSPTGTGQPNGYPSADISYGATGPSAAYFAPPQAALGVVVMQVAPGGYPQLPPTQQSTIYPVDSSSAMFSNQQTPSPQPYGRPSSASYNAHAGASFGSTSTLTPYGLGPPSSAYPSNIQQAKPISSDVSISSGQSVDRQAQLDKGKKRATQLENQLAMGRLVHEVIRLAKVIHLFYL
jgi:hypothetical protein